MGRVAVAAALPSGLHLDAIQDFISGLQRDTLGIALSYVRVLRPSLVNEAKLGRSTDDLGWNRPHPRSRL